jgi:hypothetical protein
MIVKAGLRKQARADLWPAEMIVTYPFLPRD